MPSDAPFSAIPTAMPTITGSVVFVEMQQPVITSLTEDEISEIISSAEDVFGVYPGNVVAEVTYNITGTFSLDANEDEVSDEELISALKDSLAETLNIHPSDVEVSIDAVSGSATYTISSNSVDEANALQEALQLARCSASSPPCSQFH